MRVANFTDPQFVDATGTGGLNAAFNLASGSIASVGSGAWAAPGLLFPESMSLTFSGMVGTVNLPSPWGVVSSGGVVVRAHGTQTGQDTTSYSVNFSSLVPSTGAVTAFLAASITTIQQDSFPLTGPPLGHPSYNPNFVPSVAYATTAYTVALTAVTGAVDNVTTFELARTTLTAGQVAISSYTPIGWQRATPNIAEPPLYLGGGNLTLAQAQKLILPNSTGLTHTLPLAVSGGGLTYRLVNPSASTNWTVAATTGNTIAGSSSGTVSSLTVPPYGALTVWGNATSSQWEILSANPLMMASLPNIFTAPQTIIDTSLAALALSGNGSNGVNLKLTGNGSTTPSKTIRVFNGILQVINSAYSAGVLSLDDTGNLGVIGYLAGLTLAITSTATFGSTVTVSAGGVYSNGFDPGGMQFRTTFGSAPGAGFRNDGTNLYLLISNNGQPFGGYNNLRPFSVNLGNGSIVMDGTGAGVVFGGAIQATRIVTTNGNIGAVDFPGGGILNTNGAITSNSAIFGNTLGSTGNITSNGGRLRAALGAFGSGDPNAAAILNDFTLNTSLAGYVFQRLPSGFIIQAYQGTNSTGGDFINFPIAFPNTCVEVLAGEANPVGWIAGAQPTIFGTQQLSSTNFALYVASFRSGSWQLVGGVGFRYIALGY